MRSTSARWSALTAALVAVLIAASVACAATLERPVAFDTSARVRVITPQTAAHMELEPPEWPISGVWTEARLYRSGYDHVLVVARTGGAFERFELDAASLTALQTAIDRGLAVAGELPEVESDSPLDESAEPAGGRFVRNQLLLGALVYGPSAMLIAGDDNTARAALYLATTGATILGATKLSKSETITRPQSHLSTDGGWKGAAAGAGIAYAAGLDTGEDEQAYGAAMLAGGLAGATAGFLAGRPLDAAEAHGASFGSTFGAALTAGLIGTAGGFQDEPYRGEVAGIVAGGALGYPAGLYYARHASYQITAGDVGALTVASAIGVLASVAFFVEEEDPDEQAVSAMLTTGLLAGTFAGDRLLVRPYDHTETEGWLAGIGGVAGGLIGAAIPLLIDDDGDENGAAIAGAGAGGAALGMWLTEKTIRPAKGTRRSK